MRQAEISAWRKVDGKRQCLKLRKFDDLVDDTLDLEKFNGLTVDQIRDKLWSQRLKYWTAELGELNPDQILLEFSYA